MNTLRYRMEIKNKMVPKLIGRINFARFLDLPETNFYTFIRETESSPLFKKLFYPDNRNLKVIRYEKFSGTEFYSKAVPFSEQYTYRQDWPELDSIVEGNPALLDKIKFIGEDKFKRYFLQDEEDYTTRELADFCRLSSEDVKGIRYLVEKIFLRTEPWLKVKNSPAGTRPYLKVARLTNSGSGPLGIQFLSLYHARGRYQIDYQKIKGWSGINYLTLQEKKELESLLARLELINTRKKLLFEIIRKIAVQQKDYLTSGNRFLLKPYPQKYLAQELKVNPSVICRAIWNKSIETPGGEDWPLTFFFPRKKEIIKKCLEKIIVKQGGPVSDQVLSRLLTQEYRFKISRRSVAVYRKEMENISKTEEVQVK